MLSPALLFIIHLVWTLTTVIATIEDTRDQTATAIETLKNTVKHVPGLVIVPGDPAYTEEIGEFWNIGSQEILPELIVRPCSAAEASLVVKELSKLQIPFGIRSGGHTPIPGWNTSPKVLIALTRLDTVTFNSHNGIAGIGSGLRWNEVYEALLQNNATVAGGRYAFVGVGGFLTGGGLSYLSNEYGYGADTLTNAQVVLSNGEIVDANETSNSDLFWAIKGGSNNFGLVTRFDLKTVPQPDGIWGGMMTISGEHLEKTLDAVARWQKIEQQKDLKASILISLIRGPFVDSVNMTTISLTLYYGNPTPYPEVLRPLWELPAISSTLRFTTHYNLTLELAQGDNDQKRHVFSTGTYVTSSEMNIQGHALYMSAIQETGIFDDPTAYTALTYQPISKSMLSKAAGTHPMGLDPASAPYVWLSIHVEWTDNAKTETVNRFVSEIDDALFSLASNLTRKSVAYRYLNDAGGQQNPLRSYGANNFQRLTDISRKYDPGCTFTTLCGGFKLSSTTCTSKPRAYIR